MVDAAVVAVSVKSRRTLLEERRERFLGLAERTAHAESSFSAFIAALIWSRNGAASGALAGLQRAGWFRRQLLRRFGRGLQEVLIGHDPGHQSQLRSPRGAEGLPQQDQLGRTEVADRAPEASSTIRTPAPGRG